MKNENLKQPRPLSYSSLKAFDTTPNHLVAYWNKEKAPTPAQEFGTLIHSLILEPEKFNSLYYIIDDAEICAELVADGAKSPRATSIYKNWLAEVLMKNEGKKEVKLEDYQTALKLSESARKSILLKKLKGVEELIEWDFAGQPFKGFVDGYGDGFILDIKTSADASPKAFLRDFVKYKYYWQAALYLHANRALNFAGNNPDFFVLVVETSTPYNTQIYKVSPEFIDKGFAQVAAAVQSFKDWDGSAAGYEFGEIMAENGVLTLNLPEWI